jgi:hypothetical protein
VSEHARHGEGHDGCGEDGAHCAVLWWWRTAKGDEEGRREERLMERYLYGGTGWGGGERRAELNRLRGLGNDQSRELSRSH